MKLHSFDLLYTSSGSDIDSLLSGVASYSPILCMAKADIDVLRVTRVLQMDLKVHQEPGYTFIVMQVVGQCYNRTAPQKHFRSPVGIGAGTGDCKHLRRT